MASDQLLSHSLRSAAASAPAALAVRCGDASLSYEALADRAARFAAMLVHQGLEPGDRVAVHCAKSLDAVVAIHGAQWAGAVAVPVDPGAPPEVVADVLADAAPSAVVVDTRTARNVSDVPLSDLVRVGDVDTSDRRRVTWDDVAEHDPVQPVAVGPDDPAYIIYTSGSTGTPKGIVHSHASGLAYARLAAATFHLDQHDILANVAPFHFDQSTFELYAAPVAQAATLLVPEVLLRFPAEVAKLVAAERATVWYSVPTILVHLVERGALDHHDITSLRLVLFGGEIFPSEALAALMELLPDATFSNVYGPAEVNQCTHHHLTGPPAPGASVPIGGPWAGSAVRLRNSEGEIVTGPGKGTLEVATATMMSGYWNQPALTDASIRAEAGDSGALQRWYLTGDVCERDGNDLLHFLGRSDRQVKIRGNRVELEAVEAVLSDVEGVLRAAVVVIETSAEKRLAAVVEAAPHVELDGREVLAEARGRLAPYAVPTDCVVVPALPRTTSGKIDARAACTIAREHLGIRSDASTGAT